MFDKLLELGEQPYSEDDAEWDAFVASHPQGGILQTTNWARLKNRFNWSAQRVWLKKDGQLVAGAQILFRSAAMGLLKIGYIPHGPLVDWQNEEQVAVLFNQIDIACYENRAGLVKMEPLLWQDEMPSTQWHAFCQQQEMMMLIETDTIQPPRTIIVDLRPSLDDILANMKSKTRYNIRLSAKKDVTVRQGTAVDLPLFNQLMSVTGQRDGFGVHAPIYYKAFWEIFAPEQAAMFIAEFEERPLAAIIVSAIGEKAVYLYGASSNEERQRMPAYAVQWAAIQWAKERGCSAYDLWGIPDAPEEELEADFTKRSDGLWGIYRFKRGFGGQNKRTVGVVDRIYNKRVHKLYQWRRGRE